jgi:hypothetical protein
VIPSRDPTEGGPSVPRRRRAWPAIVLLIVLAGLAYIVTLPMRQTAFTVRDHELVRGENGSVIEGELSNRGEAAPRVRVEAYLYDADGLYLATVERTYTDVPAQSTIPIRLPIDLTISDRVARYSLYAGVAPNPLAPSMD